MTTPNLLGINSYSSVFDPRKAAKLECGVFKRLQINIAPLGGTVIGWELADHFTAPEPYHFYVDFGRAGDTNWEVLNTAPIVDGCIYADMQQRYWDHLADFYYRVRLVLPNQINPSTGLPTYHLSQPTHANMSLYKSDWLIAREIIRKEYLYQFKGTNKTYVGYILKRRRWGTICPQCTDYDTTEVTVCDCPTCYGTRFVGGYFKGVDYVITTGTWPRGYFRQDNIGLTNEIVKHGRSVAFPYLDTKDVFVRRDNGERFEVGKIDQICEVGGVPIIYNVELRLAPTTNIAYTVPIEGTPSSSSSSLVAGEAELGLNDPVQW